MNKGDKLWFFDGSRCPIKVTFKEYFHQSVNVQFPDGGRTVLGQYLFEDFEELIIAVEGHSWVLNKWARENRG